MQKNEAGFKMSFKKRNPEFKKPARKVPATIPATGDLRKHDNPTRALKKSRDNDSSSSSDDDVLEQKRKVEIENQKSEQAKLVEMALLEQVMSGQIDVMDLLKSGQVDSGSLREKLQKQMLNIDGEPTFQQAPAPAPVPVPTPGPEPVPASPQKAPFNPLLRNRVDSNSGQPPVQTPKSDSRSSSKQKKNKSSGSISSESSESSSESSLDTDISSESTDSDEDSHKLAKQVKKLRTKNKKLRKKVKTLKKKLKDKKDIKDDKSSKRNSHGQIAEKKPPKKQLPPPPQIQQTAGAMVPMTPQQFIAQQAQVRRQYDPQTGQYRDVPEMPVNLPPTPFGPMPTLPPMPFGQMPAVPPGPIPTLPPSAGPLPFPSLPIVTPVTPVKVTEDFELKTIKEVKGIDPMKNFLSDDDLYLDVFKGKEEEKSKHKPNNEQQQQQQQPMPRQRTFSHGQGQQISTHVSQIRFGQMPPQQYQPLQQPPQSLPPQKVPEQKARPSHHERDFKQSSSSSESEQDEVPQGGRQKRKSSERSEVVVRSKAAKDLIKDFYEEDELAVLGNEDEEQTLGDQAAALKRKSESPSARGVTFSGKCIFCALYHTVNSKNESTSLCKKGKLYLERAKADEKGVQKLRNTVKESTEKLISLKNKRELMMKVIVENDVRKNERAERMEGYRQYILTLPEPVKVSQEFGRKVVKAQSKQQTRGQAGISKINAALQSESQHDQDYDDIDGSSMPFENAPTSFNRDHEKPPPVKSRRPRHSSESDFVGRSRERSPAPVASYGEEDYGHGRRRPQRGPSSRGPRKGSSRGSHGGHPQEGHSQGHPKEGHSQRHPQEGHSQRHPKEGHSQGHPQEGHSQGHPQEGHSQGHPQEGHSQGHPQEGHSQRHPQEGHSQRHPQGGHPHGGHAQGSSSAPPFRDMRTSPGPPQQRPGLLQTPAAGPPQRPPPAALLQTPGPGQRDPPFRDEEYEHGSRYQKRPPPRHGWSGGRAR